MDCGPCAKSNQGPWEERAQAGVPVLLAELMRFAGGCAFCRRKQQKTAKDAKKYKDVNSNAVPQT